MQDSEPVMVSGASVFIMDENGITSAFNETEPGIYKSDSSELKGRTGGSYNLSVITPEGNEYESEPCVMFPVSNIRNVYFDKDQDITGNDTEFHDGIRIFLDSENTFEGGYLRWSYSECWKIIVPSPKKYNYINDSTIVEVNQINQICWGNSTSDEIIIQSANGSSENIEKKPILFVDSDFSNRFSLRYSVEIKQLSISQKEYEFWDQMKQINESGGNIFEKQPFPVVSNIHNIADPDEIVLGYFQVSSVSRKRIYINSNEISELNLPPYIYDCSTIVRGPDDYPPPLSPGAAVTFDKIYKLYSGPDYYFIEPIYDGAGELRKLVFARNTCADCTVTGYPDRPDFWID